MSWMGGRCRCNNVAWQHRRKPGQSVWSWTCAGASAVQRPICLRGDGHRVLALVAGTRESCLAPIPAPEPAPFLRVLLGDSELMQGMFFTKHKARYKYGLIFTVLTFPFKLFHQLLLE